MERRLHTRHRARTIVYIMVPGGRRKLCKAVNLSATGVFIETTNLGLRKGQQVILAFAINLGAITKLHRRTAVVVRRGTPPPRGGRWWCVTQTTRRCACASSISRRLCARGASSWWR